MAALIHPELSYRVRGVLLDVYNTLGPMLRESFYQDAIMIGLRTRGIACDPEKEFEVYYEPVPQYRPSPPILGTPPR
jgi:GxxExxY protein